MARALTQDQVATRLHMEAKKMMRDRVEFPATDMILDLWNRTRDDIMAFARGVWDQEGGEEHPFLGEQAKARITQYMDQELKRFRDAAANGLRVAKSQAYEQQTLADAWILDQVTPPNIVVRPKRDPKAYNSDTRPPRQIEEACACGCHGTLHESWFNEPIEGETAVNPVTGEARAGTDQRLDGWLKSWEASVFSGLALSGVMADTSADVEKRIQRAAAGGVDVESVLSRMVSSEVQVAIADADDDFGEDHKDLITRYIWTTMDDEGVCPRCRAVEGAYREFKKPPMFAEAKAVFQEFGSTKVTGKPTTANIPLHPRCRCWWRTVPRDYKDLAGALAAPERGKRSMVVKDPKTGEPYAQVIVSFDGWAQRIPGQISGFPG